MVAVLLWLAPGPVLAHALDATCRLRDGKVQVDAFFDDDTPAINALVRVVNAEKNAVAEGKTDGEGRWRFEVPPSGTYQVTVDAGAGHRKTFVIVIGRNGGGVTLTRESAPGSATPGAASSGGISREEFTAFPWLKVLIGVGTIAVLSAAFLLVRRFGAKSSPRS